MGYQINSIKQEIKLKKQMITMIGDSQIGDITLRNWVIKWEWQVFTSMRIQWQNEVSISWNNVKEEWDYESSKQLKDIWKHKFKKMVNKDPTGSILIIQERVQLNIMKNKQ